MSPRRHGSLLAVAAALAAGALAAGAAPAQAQQLLGAWGRLGEDPGQFSELRDVAVDPRGYVYVLDHFKASDGRVSKFTPAGKLVRQWGRSADPRDRTDNAEKPALIYEPRAIAVGPDGNVYVAEDGSGRTRISVWSPLGRYLRAFGAGGRGAGQLNDPNGMAFDPAGRLVVADSANARLTLFGPGGQAGGAIQPDAEGAELRVPRDVVLGPDGLLYVADPSQIKRYATDGTFAGFIGERGEAPGPFFYDNDSLAFAGSELVVADAGLSRVQRFAASGAYVGPLGGSPGSQPGQFDSPVAVASGCGSVYVADRGNARVQRFAMPAAAACGDPFKDSTEGFSALLGGPKNQPFREEFALRPGVLCSRPCRGTLRATARLGGRTIRFAREEVRSDYPTTLEVGIAPGERSTDQLVAALRRGRRITARATLTVKDLTGRARTVRRTYRLR